MRFLLLLLLTACAYTPQKMTVAECERWGVIGKEPTGTVVISEWRTYGGIRKVCGDGFAGCSIPLGDNQWAIYYSDHKCMPQHEACHAQYETMLHTHEFNMCAMSGYQFCSCNPRA